MVGRDAARATPVGGPRPHAGLERTPTVEPVVIGASRPCAALAFAGALTLGTTPTPAAVVGEELVGPAYGPPADATLEATVGILGGLAPDYPGSDDYRLIPAPYVHGSYREIVFVRGSQLGLNALRLGSRREGFGFRAGAIAALDPGRDTDANDAVDSLDDVDFGVEVGGFAELAYLFAALRLEARREVAGGHGGVVVDLVSEFSLPLTSWLRVDLEVGTRWADADYMAAYFGVTPGQAAITGLAAHDPGAGVTSVDVLLGATYFLTESWLLRVQGAYGRLLGDAADSPIVDDKGSPNQFFIGLGGAYRFAF